MKKFTAFILAFIFSFGASANELGGVKSYVGRVIDSTVMEIFGKGATREQQIVSFRNALGENLDFAHIGRFVLGVYGRGADEAKLSAFTASFAELNVQSYARKFSGYGGQKVEVVGANAAKKDGEFFVDTKVIASDPSEKDLAITWRVAGKDGAYKVIDIVIEGVSMAMSYRNEYAPLLKAAADDGKDPVAGLTSRIDERIEALRGGQ